MPPISETPLNEDLFYGEKICTTGNFLTQHLQPEGGDCHSQPRPVTTQFFHRSYEENQSYAGEVFCHQVDVFGLDQPEPEHLGGTPVSIVYKTDTWARWNGHVCDWCGLCELLSTIRLDHQGAGCRCRHAINKVLVQILDDKVTTVFLAHRRGL